MIVVDESDPVGEVALSFPYRDVQIRKNVDPKDVYDLDEEIGRGKFGTVYRCREKASGLHLAAKFVGVPKKEDRRNVEREVEIMRELQHARLIQLYDAFENGKVMCVVLELIEGGELFERVIDDDFVLTEKSCTAFMRQICEGVAFIHKQRILHLDMKPENILCLTKTGNRVKIIDFGLARRFDPDKKLQVLFGTPEFVAPEVVNFDRIGYGTDMWSVGVICYVLLSGLSPFMGHTDCETMANVTIAKYDFDDEAFEDISDGAKDFIRKLLIKDIAARTTAEECLKHPWLRRRAVDGAMDVAKDNLKLFVERWNEHPNSPYGVATAREPPSRSLSAPSPSPCGSLASSASPSPSPPPEHVRRASDSAVAEKADLAAEIRQLSDRLFRLSALPVPHVQPMRAAKFRVTAMHRDAPPHSSPSFRDAFHSKLSRFERRARGPDGTNDLLLQLLERWDDEAQTSPPPPVPVGGGRPKSHSIADWGGGGDDDDLGQRTISSLNTFFRSRASNRLATFRKAGDGAAQHAP